jgi:hypothetical protein
VNVKATFWSTIISILVGSFPISAAAPRAKAPVRHFVCDVGYTLEDCHVHMVVLRQTLAEYPTNGLGDWTWILVRSKDWKRIFGEQAFDPSVPAFSYLPKRETFIEEALVARVSSRSVELSGLWHMTVDELRDLAVRHELGHAVCNERDETKANRAAELLLQRKPISCDRTFSMSNRLGPIRRKH